VVTTQLLPVPAIVGRRVRNQSGGRRLGHHDDDSSRPNASNSRRYFRPPPTKSASSRAIMVFGRILSRLRSPRYKNEGSLARDLLASERTFLAWTRTGLGFIALGVALEKVEAFAAIAPTLLRMENSNTKLAAGMLVASGSACVAHGTARYFAVMRALQEGIFIPNRVGIMGLSALSIGIAFAGTLLVLENEQDTGRNEKMFQQEEKQMWRGVGDSNGKKK